MVSITLAKTDDSNACVVYPQVVSRTLTGTITPYAIPSSIPVVIHLGHNPPLLKIDCVAELDSNILSYLTLNLKGSVVKITASTAFKEFSNGSSWNFVDVKPKRSGGMVDSIQFVITLSRVY